MLQRLALSIPIILLYWWMWIDMVWDRLADKGHPMSTELLLPHVTGSLALPMCVLLLGVRYIRGRRDGAIGILIAYVLVLGIVVLAAIVG